MRSTLVTILTALLLMTQTCVQPALADEEENRSKVPWIVAGITAAAGVLYFVFKATGSEEETPQAAARALIHYEATPEERKELDGITDPDEVKAFLARFFEARDPSPDDPINEFRDVHIERFEHATTAFGGAEGGWKSDRGRVHILRGEPASIQRFPFADVDLGSTQPGGFGDLRWASVEVWEYDEGSGGNALPDLFSDPTLFPDPPSRGRMLFIFADQGDGSGYEQVFSTEPGEVIDARLYHIAR